MMGGMVKWGWWEGESRGVEGGMGCSGSETLSQTEINTVDKWETSAEVLSTKHVGPPSKWPREEGARGTGARAGWRRIQRLQKASGGRARPRGGRVRQCGDAGGNQTKPPPSGVNEGKRPLQDARGFAPADHCPLDLPRRPMPPVPGQTGCDGAGERADQARRHGLGGAPSGPAVDMASACL
ncbi:hypothetical protein BC628DRAFT_1006502 [Trametes gibbosa]|nr:hypothetical protein BC628DRAFT_1006502 [Trametes gibbosa]